jgi:hypothetical protein
MAMADQKPYSPPVGYARAVLDDEERCIRVVYKKDCSWPPTSSVLPFLIYSF